MGGRVGARPLRSHGSAWTGRGASLLLVLYVAWIAFPALHQLQLRLQHGGVHCKDCPAAAPDWRILSHSPDQPCSDPAHHHHPRPVHDEDHCPVCRLGAGTGAVLPVVGALQPLVPLTCFVVERDVLAPLTPALWTLSPRAPPPPPTA